MRKGPKYTDRHEKQSAAQILHAIASSLEASPTTGGHTAVDEKSTDDSKSQNNKGIPNVPPLPKEFHAIRIDWGNLIGMLAAAIGGLAVMGGVIFWFAKLDSKVDTTASNIADIKPKVEELVINSGKQDIRLGNLEKAQSTRENANHQK